MTAAEGDPQAHSGDPRSAVIQSAVGMTQILVELIATLRQGIDKLERQIGQAAGHTPTFLSSIRSPVPVRPWRRACWPPSARCATAMPGRADVQKFTGIAPVIERSGKAHGFHFRRACPRFFRQTFHEWAGSFDRLLRWAAALLSPAGTRGKTITPRSGHWLSSGSFTASPSAAGRTASLTTMPAMSGVSPSWFTANSSPRQTGRALKKETHRPK